MSPSDDGAWPELELPITPPFAPMEAKSVPSLPSKGVWQFEPKWDGFRCLAFRGPALALQSKAGQPLLRYFPELGAALLALGAERFVLDGEIVIPDPSGGHSFDDLLQRIHPADSRVLKLATETPSELHVFDLLVDDEGRSLVDQDVLARRAALERFADRFLKTSKRVILSPATTDRATAEKWQLDLRRVGFDGVIAKRAGVPYRSGDRTGMQKIKWLRTADCVVGGFRYGAKTRTVGSLLLGLYDDDGTLHHVGFTSNMPSAERDELTKKLESLRKPPGFSGKAPGGPSRWSTERSGEWEPLDPVLVVEVSFDHWSQGRFRHGTSFQRWRPEKDPKQCTFEQVEPARAT